MGQALQTAFLSAQTAGNHRLVDAIAQRSIVVTNIVLSGGTSAGSAYLSSETEGGSSGAAITPLFNIVVNGNAQFDDLYIVGVSGDALYVTTTGGPISCMVTYYLIQGA